VSPVQQGFPPVQIGCEYSHGPDCDPRLNRAISLAELASLATRSLLFPHRRSAHRVVETLRPSGRVAMVAPVLVFGLAEHVQRASAICVTILPPCPVWYSSPTSGRLQMRGRERCRSLSGGKPSAVMLSRNWPACSPCSSVGPVGLPCRCRDRIYKKE